MKEDALTAVFGQDRRSGNTMMAIQQLCTDATWALFRETLAAQADSRDFLAREADAWLANGPLSIVDKKHLAPSGDPHDYVSIGPYWWPDPAKPDGLPWIVRDGEVNPVFYEYDNRRLEHLCHALTHLILQAATANSEPHARAAGRFLRAWFLDEATRMNPHLSYAQFVPGHSNGRGIGIIDTTSLVFVVDLVPRLPFTSDWTPAHLAELKDWFSRYVDWLLTSENGKCEAAERNNHGTWYDVQVAHFALFCNRPEQATTILATTARERLSAQFEPDGSQPHELARTLALTYTTYNLLGFACLAEMARRNGDDLWRWKTSRGATLLSGVEWMRPYYAGAKAWSHQQLKPFNFAAASLLLTLAAQGTGDSSWSDRAQRLAGHPWKAITFSKADLSGRKPPSSKDDPH